MTLIVGIEHERDGKRVETLATGVGVAQPKIHNSRREIGKAGKRKRVPDGMGAETDAPDRRRATVISSAIAIRLRAQGWNARAKRWCPRDSPQHCLSWRSRPASPQPRTDLAQHRHTRSATKPGKPEAVPMGKNARFAARTSIITPPDHRRHDGASAACRSGNCVRRLGARSSLRRPSGRGSREGCEQVTNPTSPLAESRLPACCSVGKAKGPRGGGPFGS